ncbi:MAG: 3'(2'),5'-bisphosphate nucleotidase CysQ [Candidatus Acidiferrales bacterium]
MTKYRRDLDRIVSALEAGGKIYRSRSWETVRVEKKSGGDPVTDAEREVNQLLFEILVQDGEGWLSEESADNEERLKRSRVWLVDPLDGTKEYVRRIPEWCISIALMEDGDLVCGGIYNPQTDEMFYGCRETGVMCKNSSSVSRLDGEKRAGDVLVLASRSEVARGEWKRFQNRDFRLQPMGSVAYKLALVAAEKADATWTLTPKNEWDVAAGVALLLAARGHVRTSEGFTPSFNNRNTLLPGLVGLSATGIERLRPFLEHTLTSAEFQDCLPWAQSLASLRS